MDLNKLREITEKLNRSELLKGHAYPVLDLFIKQQNEALILPAVSQQREQLAIDGLKRIVETTKDSWSRQIAEQFLYEIEEIGNCG